MSAPAALRSRLTWGAPRGLHCSSNRRNRHGHRVASCTFHPGHEGDHRDVHTGHTWK